MANIKSQVKRNRQNEKRRVRNQSARSELKTRVKEATKAVDENATDAPDKIRIAQQRIDRAQAKGRIHKNQAARRTSRLMRRSAKG